MVKNKHFSDGSPICWLTPVCMLRPVSGCPVSGPGRPARPPVRHLASHSLRKISSTSHYPAGESPLYIERRIGHPTVMAWRAGRSLTRVVHLLFYWVSHRKGKKKLSPCSNLSSTQISGRQYLRYFLRTHSLLAFDHVPKPCQCTSHTKKEGKRMKRPNVYTLLTRGFGHEIKRLMRERGAFYDWGIWGEKKTKDEGSGGWLALWWPIGSFSQGC